MESVPEAQLQWLIQKSSHQKINSGELIFKPGDPIDKLIIILKGDFNLKVQRDNHFKIVGKFSAASITGLLPYSRATTARGYAEALHDAEVLILEKQWFTEMINQCHDLTTVFVQAMSSRIRQFTKREQQDDKIMALGKLSAGLAHELNNPSAAVVRSSQELLKHLKLSPNRFKEAIKIDLSDAQIDRINESIFSKIQAGSKTLTLMEKSELEDDLMDWFEDHNINGGDEIAETFVEYGIEVEDLEYIVENASPEYLAPIFGWINQLLTTEKLVSEIEDASKRINDLVKSIKSYTHMDQAPEKASTDIHIGLDNTLKIFNHKLRGIDVVKNYQEDLPQPEILAGPINQVWTNLIDNAIDAMENQEVKKLTITTKKEGDFVNVIIQDTGSGIPQEMIDQIFDPFFTTKPIGKGTGLGLEFVQQIVKVQHNGAVYVDSKPGDTKFTICFPIHPKT